MRRQKYKRPRVTNLHRNIETFYIDIASHKVFVVVAEELHLLNTVTCSSARLRNVNCNYARIYHIPFNFIVFNMIL